MNGGRRTALLILNQMAGPMTWELAEDAGEALGPVALLTGHPDTLRKSHARVSLYAATPYQRGSLPRRALSWLNYWIQAFFWLCRWPADIPLLIFSNPPIICWLGWLMKKVQGRHYAVMVHDIYPDILASVAGCTPRHPLIRLWYWLNRHSYEHAEVVMTLGEGMAANLTRQFDVRKTTAGKLEIVYPWVDTEKIKPIPKIENCFAQRHGQIGRITVMYAGNMGLGHDLESMVEAARQLSANPKVHFMFVGAGPKWDWINETIQRKGLLNATLLPWQPEEALGMLLATADIALVSLEKAMAGMAVPSKAIYALAAGAALIVLTDEQSELGDWQAIYDFGLRVAPGQLGQALLDVMSDPARLHNYRKKARSTAKAVFSRKENGQRLLDVLGRSFEGRMNSL